MGSFSLDYLLKDLKKLDKAQLFEQVKVLYYENEKQANKILDLQASIAKYEKKKMKKLPNESHSVNYEGYKPEWIMAEKIVFILKRNKKAMATKEIINELLNIEPSLNEAYKDKIKIVSNFIHNTLKRGFIVRSAKSIGGGYTYCLAESV